MKIGNTTTQSSFTYNDNTIDMLIDPLEKDDLIFKDMKKKLTATRSSKCIPQHTTRYDLND
jgi:hypothetical protein